MTGINLANSMKVDKYNKYIKIRGLIETMRI